MILAMALYAMMDAAVKLTTDTIPQGQVLVAVGLVGLAAFASAAAAKGLRPLPLAVFRGAALWRTVLDSAASTLFILALNAVALSLFTTIMQANPLLVMLGAALFLGEPVGWRRWLAILIGLCGVLIVLRPTGDSFTPAALLVVAGVILQAGRDLVTRRVAPGIDSMQLSAGASLGLIPVGVIVTLTSQNLPVVPEGVAWLYLAGTCLLFIPAVYAMVAAMRVGEVGFVAPFRYSRTLFGLGLGVLIFGESLDLYMLLGAAIIVGSGLYSLWREARLRHPSQTAPKPL